MPELENLDDAGFSELMKRSVSEIPELCPEWTDFNAHDPGITFLEMLMWLIEMQRYYLYQITESHLESYLRLIGTTARTDEPAVILARFFPEETVLIKKDNVFYIGDIPYQPIDDTVITPDKLENACRENKFILIKQDIMPFKGRIMPICFSHNDENDINPMREDFYSRAEIKARLITRNGEIECSIKDGTYGLYQNGFIDVSIPEEFDENEAVLKLEVISDSGSELPSTSCFRTDIRRLIQLDGEGQTLGADGTVKENVAFSANIAGQEIDALVYKKIESGKNAETQQDAFNRFNAERLSMPRAVSKEDYARIALEAPGLRAELVNVFSKETGKVTVCVKTACGSLCESEIKNLRKVLFEAKPVGTEIEILTPVIFSARLTVSAKTDGWAGGRKLTEHIRSIFGPLEKRMGALINMQELFKQIGSSPIVSEINGMRLRLGQGVELTENDTMKLPEDGLLSLNEIMIQ